MYHSHSAFSKTLYPTILRAMSWTNIFNNGLFHSDLFCFFPHLKPTLYPGREMGMKYLIPTCKDTKQQESPVGNLALACFWALCPCSIVPIAQRSLV